MAGTALARAPVERTPTPLVRAREVSYLAGGRLLVRNVSLDAGRGEVVGLIGPNGAGKTTLLRLLGGLLRPTTGLVAWPDGDGTIGFMGHETYLYGHLTARENLEYYAILRGLGGAVRAREVPARLGEVGLTAVADATVRSFSRGMAQRLAFARALLGEPAVLLLDEPESGLDRNARGLLAAVLERARARGQTVVWSGHDVPFVVSRSDRVIVLHRGRVAHRSVGGEGAVASVVAAFPDAAGIMPPRLLGER